MTLCVICHEHKVRTANTVCHECESARAKAKTRYEEHTPEYWRRKELRKRFRMKA